MIPDIHIVGLTGGIASGKSTVAGFLREAGCPVLDADDLGRMVLEKGHAAYDRVIETFGRDILADDGRIDRKRLGAQVFDNADERAKLEAITHPAIADLARKGMAMIAARGETLAFYEAALLVETGIYKSLAGLVVVSCSIETQVARLVARDGFSKPAAAARIASQFPLEEKTEVADFVISTEGELDATQQQTLEVLSRLRNQLHLTDEEGR